MSRKSRTAAVMILAAALIALGACTVPGALAKPSAIQRALLSRIVLWTVNYDIVRTNDGIVQWTVNNDIVKDSTDRGPVKRRTHTWTVTPAAAQLPVPEPTPTETPTPTPTPIPVPAAVNVVDYGAKGDGVSDDTAAIAAAMNAALGAEQSVYLPAGTYKVGSIRVPNGLTVTGAGMSASWLKGHLDFGSDQYISDLKIGDLGVSAVKNTDGASSTTFERVRFRGGGGRNWTYVVSLGSGADCDHITFRACQIERNLGVEVVGEDRGFNNVSVWTDRSGVVSDITFEGCHMGVSNGQGGHDTGSPRMGLECYVHSDTAPTGYGWRNIVLRDCVFEAADCHTADFSDIPSARGTGLLIEGCLFKGGGYTNVKWQWTLDLEMPLNPIIRNNTFLRGNGNWGYVLAVVDRGDTAYKSSGATITGNIFDLDYDNGIPISLGWPFVLQGLRQSLHRQHGQLPLRDATPSSILDRAYGNTVTDNTFNIGKRTLFGSINGSSGQHALARTR